MKRREFITLLGSTAAAWPLAARAQQPRMPVIGFLDSGTPTGMDENLAGFRRGFGESGFQEGKNLTIEYRWAMGHYDQLPALVADLLQHQVAVIAATRGPAPARAAKAATATVPIVFQSGGDPVQDGLIASLNRPGGNVTGASRMTVETIEKRCGIILEVVPNATAVGLLVNPSSPQRANLVQKMQQATRARGVALHIANASSAGELDAAIATVAQSGAAALVEGNDPMFIGQRKRIVALTNSNKIPTIFFESEPVAEGGLMSYDANFADSFRQVGAYVGRILKGENPADLPVLQPTKFELVINLKTAKALGLKVPPTLLAIADQVIE